MPLKRLDHVNVRTNRLAEMIAWYGEVLGMEPGPRPDFGFPGAWLYCAGNPIVHLVEVRDEPAALGPKIEHFAMSAEGLDGFLGTLEAKGIPYEIGRPPGFPIIQVNFFDPDRNHLHVDFSTDEADALTSRGL